MIVYPQFENNPLLELDRKSIVILGFGVEGRNTLCFLRKHFPNKLIAISDAHLLEKMDISSQQLIKGDQHLCLHLGNESLSNIVNYDVIFKTPGIPSNSPDIIYAKSKGSIITSEAALFFSLCKSKIVGITGTKGKSTTASLIHTMLTNSEHDVHLIGNIGPEFGGKSPLLCLDIVSPSSVFVYELSSFQLENITCSPNIAVLLNTVSEHIDHHGSFDQYVAAKENITRYQNSSDFLIYNDSFELLRDIAHKTNANLLPCSVDKKLQRGCFVSCDKIVCSFKSVYEEIITTSEVEVTLPGRFNLYNVLPSIAAAKLLGVQTKQISSAIQTFNPLKDRFEYVGKFQGISFYNAAIATVPEATIKHIETLRPMVTTVLLGGYDRGIDYSGFAQFLLKETSITTLIFFPDSGHRIWESILSVAKKKGDLPKHYFVEDMEQAVRIAYRSTPIDHVCLHSPASPSRGGLFRDYTERGQLFREWVIKLSRQ